MATRIKHHQTCHNTAVSKSAAQYVSNGYDVQADIPRCDSPSNLEVDGKKIETLSIVSLLYQMEYNEWNKALLLGKKCYGCGFIALFDR